jgi:hypothetical protein
MPKHLFAAFLIVIICLSSFCFVQSKLITIKVTFSAMLHILSNDRPLDYNGSGYVYDDSLTYVISNWPSFEGDKAEFKLDRTYQQLNPRTDNVNFTFIVSLGEIKRVLTIDDFKDAGGYKGTVSCVFSGLFGGRAYDLRVYLLVDNANNNDIKIEHLIAIK